MLFTLINAVDEPLRWVFAAGARRKNNFDSCQYFQDDIKRQRGRQLRRPSAISEVGWSSLTETSGALIIHNFTQPAHILDTGIHVANRLAYMDAS